MQKVFKQILIALVAVSVYFLPGPFEPYGGLAQVESPLPEPNSIVTSYAKDFGVSYAEAERRLILQNEMDALESKVIAGEPTYAGSWTQHQPEFGLVVAFASPNGEKLIQKYLDGIKWADLVKVQQSPYTVAELDDILAKVVPSTQETKISFSAGANYRTAKVELYTPQPDDLRSQLQAKDDIQPYIKDVTFVYQEAQAAPAELKYPYLLGGHTLSTCTSGFVMTRNTDSRRFMSTSGHCPDSVDVVYNGVNSIYLGPMIIENDPEHNEGANWAIWGEDIDLQLNDVSARSFDLTNVIRVGATSTEKVTGTQVKAGMLDTYVCKYGKITGQTCGLITNITYAPAGVYGASDNYVQVRKIAGAIGDMGCPGDSGSPVYKYVVGGVTGLGVLSGHHDVPCTGNNANFFFYTPVDEISRVGYSILTSHYQQRYHQNVFWTEANCIEYRTSYDDNGNSILPASSQACSTSAPGSGTIETYTAYVVGNYWREGMWRNGIGYTRNVPLNNNGTINWGAGAIWSQCCSGTAPRSQDAYIVGNHYYQNVYWTETTCTEYKRALDNDGNPTGAQTSQNCRTSLPAGSSGTINSYTAYVVGGRLREGVWRNGIGYVRDVPLNATNTDIDWNNAPAWQQCCVNTPPRAQGGDVLSYP